MHFSGKAMFLAASLVVAPLLHAATFTVTNLNDSGSGSLRQAVLNANGAAGSDIIDFATTGSITLTSGEILITDSLEIQGPGAAQLIVGANLASRVLHIANAVAALDVRISGITIRQGDDTFGGGILVEGESLTLDSVTVASNSGSVGAGVCARQVTGLTIRNSGFLFNESIQGGGLLIDDAKGPVLIQDCGFASNVGIGGGIFIGGPDAPIEIERTTITDNSANSGVGGGIYVLDTDGAGVTISRCEIFGNSAAEGGGIYHENVDAAVLIENSTISSNQATNGNGGGIYAGVQSGGATFTLNFVTVALNTATTEGGGIYSQAQPVRITNSIVGDNDAPAFDDVGNLIGGSFQVSYSLIEAPTGATVTDDGGNVFNQDPALGPLANNSGSFSHMLLGSSPAINAANPAFAPPPSFDQRGLPRIVGPAADMGAVEVDAGVISFALGASAIAEDGGSVAITVTRTGGTDNEVSVSFTTTNGSAVSGTDYTNTAVTVTFPAGDSDPRVVNVPILNDAIDEADETFSAALANPTGGATIAAPASHIVTITDGDLASAAVPIPTLGAAGQLLLGLCIAMAGLLIVGRRLS